MVSRSRKARRRTQLNVFCEELNAWIGAEVRVWYFSCTHDRLVLRLARGEEGDREFRFLKFALCESIVLRDLGRLTQFEISDLRGKLWRFDATGISIVFWSCSLTELGADALQEMAGLAPPIFLDSLISIPTQTRPV